MKPLQFYDTRPPVEGDPPLVSAFLSDQHEISIDLINVLSKMSLSIVDVAAE